VHKKEFEDTKGLMRNRKS